MNLQQNAFAKQQDKIAHLQKFIARFKAKASKAKQAQSRVKALDRMEKIAPLLSEADEAEVERLYQRLKTVGYLDPKSPGTDE